MFKFVSISASVLLATLTACGSAEFNDLASYDEANTNVGVDEDTLGLKGELILKRGETVVLLDKSLNVHQKCQLQKDTKAKALGVKIRDYHEVQLVQPCGKISRGFIQRKQQQVNEHSNAARKLKVIPVRETRVINKRGGTACVLKPSGVAYAADALERPFSQHKKSVYVYGLSKECGFGGIINADDVRFL